MIVPVTCEPRAYRSFGVRTVSVRRIANILIWDLRNSRPIGAGGMVGDRKAKPGVGGIPPRKLGLRRVAD